MPSLIYPAISFAQEKNGETAQTAVNSRQIDVDVKANDVDVKAGEAVTFNIDGKAFSWKLDGIKTKSSFDMSKIAQVGVLNRKVTIYIDRTPPDNS
ncbi:hypothetical protein AAKU58_004311 [Oxalobacteraceae bacterium GrIS 1.18]